MSDRPLTNKQAAFCREYTIDRNATAAYKRAGYKDSQAAMYNACRLISKDKIKQEISRYEAESRAEVGVTRETIADMYRAGYKIADIQKNPTGMATNTTGMARVYGLLQDNVNTTTDIASPLTEQQVDEYRAMAQAANRDRISPHLSTSKTG